MTPPPNKMNKGIIKRGNTWSYVVMLDTPDGKKPKWFSKDEHGRPFATKAAAIAARHIAIAQMATGTHIDPSRQTVGEWLRTWLENRGYAIKGTTDDRYRQMIEYYLLPVFGTIQLARLKTSDIERGYQKLHQSGGNRSDGVGVSAGTIKGAHRVLRAALNAAVADGLIASNPCLRASLPKVEKKPVEVLDARQVVEFEGLVKAHRLYAAVHLGMHTGMRKGECAGLRWRDIDFEKRTLTVRTNAQMVPDRNPNATKKRIRIETSTKGNELRVLSISSTTVEVLKEHRRRQRTERRLAGDLWEDGDQVFLTEFGVPIYPDTLAAVMTKYSKRLTLRAGQAKPSFHTLRHTHASLLLLNGEAVHVVSKRLGHSSTRVTLDVYAHLLPHSDKDAADAFESIIAGATFIERSIDLTGNATDRLARPASRGRA